MDTAPKLDRKQLRDALHSHLARLAAEVDATRRDAGFHEALRAMAIFWRYSPFNQFAIRIQRPDAMLVAGRRTWETLGRKVKPGERAIAVLAPTRRSFGYVGVPVFDVRQTRGRRLPVVEKTLRGRSRHVRTLEGAAASLGIEVAYVQQATGFSARSHGGRVEVDPSLPGRERVRCLAHELAHEVLHQAERARALARKRAVPALTHAQKETEAEATAYVVLAVLGLEPPSPAYIAWQGGTGETVLRSLGRVQRAARRILEAAGCGLDCEHQVAAALSHTPAEESRRAPRGRVRWTNRGTNDERDQGRRRRPEHEKPAVGSREGRCLRSGQGLRRLRERERGYREATRPRAFRP